jgi:hypothetical protein
MAGYGASPYGVTFYGDPKVIGAVLPAGLGPVTGQVAVTTDPVQVVAARPWLLVNAGPDPVTVTGPASWVGLLLPSRGQLHLPPLTVTLTCSGAATVSLFAP